MFLRKKKAQSTAEYAILLGLVVAVAAGILQLTLKSGVRAKQQQGLNFLMNAGDTELNKYTGDKMDLYTQEYSDTTVYGGDQYKSETVQDKGGVVRSFQKQTTATTSVTIESINATK